MAPVEAISSDAGMADGVALNVMGIADLAAGRALVEVGGSET
jgi:hypothetical protein